MRESGGSGLKALLLSAVCAGIYSCAPQPSKPSTAQIPTRDSTPPLVVPFVAEDVQPFVGVGTGSIRGEAFLKQRGGGVVTCAGSDVLISPDVNYFRTRVLAIKAGVIISRDDYPLAAEVLRTTKCNSRGEFEITGLKPGNWLVSTLVTWLAGYSMQGGLVFASVAVEDGRQSQILISGP